MTAHYTCPTCRATKELSSHTAPSRHGSTYNPPDRVPCGWRGCTDYAIRTRQLDAQERT